MSATGEEPDGGLLVRPFYLTGGRTRGRIALDALVRRATTHDRPDRAAVPNRPDLEEEHLRILDLCAEPVAVAEVAGRLQLPLGVARVLLDDLVDAGCLEVALDRPHLDDA